MEKSMADLKRQQLDELGYVLLEGMGADLRGELRQRILELFEAEGDLAGVPTAKFIGRHSS
jgi:hypothetical protein